MTIFLNNRLNLLFLVSSKDYKTKNMKRVLFISAFIISLFSVTLSAQQGTKRTSSRQVAQQARIADGVKSDDLTRKETARLEHEQKRIEIEKRVAKADGTVTPQEKRFLRKEQKRASRHIAKQKNDTQERKF